MENKKNKYEQPQIEELDLQIVEGWVEGTASYPLGDDNGETPNTDGFNQK